MLGNITLDPKATSDQTAWDKAYNKLNLQVSVILAIHILICLSFIAWSVSEWHLPEYFANGKVADAGIHGMNSLKISVGGVIYNIAAAIPFSRLAKRAEDNLGKRPEAATV